MKYKVLITLIFIFSLFSLSFVAASTLTSTGGNFNVTPDTLYINWSSSYNGSMSLGMSSSMVLTVENGTHTIKTIYGQPGSGWNYGLSSYDLNECGISAGFMFFVDNGTERTQNTLNTTSATMILDSKKDAACPPGRYWGMINVTNGFSTNYANVTVVMDLPVTSANSFDASSGLGQFRGILGPTNKTYHSYFFNTSEVANATSITVFMGQDADVFLFDGGVFKAKNILGTSGRMAYQYVPQNDFWEIRVFENSSTFDYSGTIAFSTLNATNASNPSQQLSSINFGSKSPSDSGNVDVRLRNEGNLALSSVAESKELYHTDFYSGSYPGNVSFRVPDFATRVRAELKWSGGANYTLKLYKPDGTLATTSDGNYLNANVTGATQEENVEYVPSGTIGYSDDGLWKVEVVNNTAATGGYDLEFKVWLGTVGLNTSYTATIFNTTGETKDLSFIFTVQNQTLSGTQNGSLGYTSASGAVLKIPFTVNVTAPELFVNNTFSSSMINVNENIGANRTITLNITINNTGNQDLVLSKSNSTSLDYSTNYMNFSYAAPSSLPAGASSLINVTIDIDTTKTNNTAGVYTGWIYLNDSNARPYSSFNLTLQVTLSSSLTVNINNITTSDGDSQITSSSVTENVTLKTKVYYANGTVIEDELNLTNFGSVYLSNKNITHTETISDSSLIEEGGNLWHGSPDYQYWLNFTLPGSTTRPGGYYDVYVSANKTLGGFLLSGTGHNGTLKVPGAGLSFSEEHAISANFDEEGQTEYYTIKIVNYGITKTTAQMNLTLSGPSECHDYMNIDVENVTNSTVVDANCGIDAGGTKFTMDVDPGGSCLFTWEVKVDSVIDSDYVINEDCVVSVKTDERHFDGLPEEGFNLYISQGSSSQSGGDDETSEIEMTYYPTNLAVAQGSTKNFDIKVKNTGDTPESNIKLSISGINSSWYSYTPSNHDLISGIQGTFKVNLTIPSDAEVKNYDIIFKVDNGDVSDSKTSALKVIPSEQEKERINESYGECMVNYTELELKMKQMFFEGKNVTELNETLLQIKSKLEDLCRFMENDDYYNASLVEKEVMSLLSIATLLSEGGTEAGVFDIMGETKNYVWLFIGVVIIVIAGFLLYMFMPAPKESHAVKKFKYVSPSDTGSPINKIKKEVRKILARFKGTGKKEKSVKAGYSWKKK